MATKTITITGEAYRALHREKRKDESFSDFALRLTKWKGDISDYLGAWDMSDEDLKVFEEIDRSWELSDKELKRRLKGI